MKSVSAVLLLATLCLVQAARPRREDEKYTTKYDNVDMDEILGNDRLLNGYFDCLMDRAGCSPEGQELKGNMGDALTTDCAKCSKKQKEGLEKTITFIIQNKPEMWKEVQTKYDPQGTYSAKHAAELEKISKKNK